MLLRSILPTAGFYHRDPAVPERFIMATLEVTQEITKEVQRQEELWGTEFDSLNTPNDWTAYICYYVAKGAYDGRNREYSTENFRKCLVKAAAMCVAAVNIIDTEGACAKRHYD